MVKPVAASRHSSRTATRFAKVVLTGSVLTLGLAGCGTDSSSNACAEDQVAPSALALVVSVHQNTPAPGVPTALKCDLEATLGAGHPVNIVGLDGDPEVVAKDGFSVSSNAKNPDARKAELVRTESAVVESVKALEASSDGADLIAGLRVAADWARSKGAPDARIVLIDSGLPDRGLLNMTIPGMIGADPAEVAEFLNSQGALNALSGMQVSLVGVGYTTSPQPPLAATHIDNVTAILKASLEDAGATVTVLPVPRTGEGPSTSFVTTPAPLPSTPTFDPGTTIVYDASSALAFVGDSETEFLFKDSATAATADLASWLQADPSRRADIVGTVASVGPESNWVNFSLARANTVRDLLVGQGVDPGQITTRGAGYIADPPDRLPDGSLDPTAAVANRSVRITTSEGS